MPEIEKPLKAGFCGPYGQIAATVLPEGLGLLFMPSLAALLDWAEEVNEAPLTEAQVVRIRDEAMVVVTPLDVAAAVEGGRGYPEVDRHHPWRSWQTLRKPSRQTGDPE